MSYVAPYIDETGIHTPTYNDIVARLVERAKAIFGAGLYLGEDSQDYQLISAFAEKIFDTNQLLVMVYNSRSPSTSFGVALDSVVGINGIRRKMAARSTVALVLSGDPGTVVTGGYVAGMDGQLWDLPGSVTMNEDGVGEAVATCRSYGVVYAAPDTITEIKTPTRGWLEVTNPESAIVGSITENDADLRARQVVSVASPSRSLLDGLKAALRQLPDVTRSQAYENQNSEPDERGISPHSVCAVVEGAEDADVARTVYLKKGPGCGTHGDVVCDVETDGGDTLPIRFMRPSYVDIEVELEVVRLPGFSDAALDQVKLSILEYLASLGIGESLITSTLWMVTGLKLASMKTPGFAISAILAARVGETPSGAPVAMAFNEVARGNINDIIIHFSGGDGA